jgi:hypothetical protein
MTPEQTLDWLAQQHFDQCREDRPVQYWIRKMKSQLPPQPEQEPVAMWDGYHQVEFGNLSAYKLEKSSWIPLYTTLTLPEQERNFCPRCGKRTADPTTIHTCTPPQGNT